MEVRYWKNLVFLVCAVGVVASLAAGTLPANQKPYEEWTLEEAVQILTRSPWAIQQTYTRLISGIGSGLRGEKELYNTFFVRFLSALPVRKAYARVEQIQQSYDALGPEKREQLDQSVQPLLDLDVEQWIVVTVSFRSNNPDMESRVRQFWGVQTVETMRNRAFLSTKRFAQVRLAAYYPPLEEAVGAKFVFPREIEDAPVVSPEEREVIFELLDVPGAEPHLSATFTVSRMIIDGELVL